jgi:hypothetical protein
MQKQGRPGWSQKRQHHKDILRPSRGVEVSVAPQTEQHPKFARRIQVAALLECPRPDADDDHQATHRPKRKKVAGAFLVGVASYIGQRHNEFLVGPRGVRRVARDCDPIATWPSLRAVESRYPAIESWSSTLRPWAFWRNASPKTAAGSRRAGRMGASQSSDVAERLPP